MKIAMYKGLYYVYISNKKAKGILTTHSEEAPNEYRCKNGEQFLGMQDNELSEIFEIRYKVKYNTGIPGVPFEWGVGSGMEDVNGDTILIRFSDGFLPGWDIEEKDVCLKYVNKNDIEFGEVIKTFYKKTGVLLDSPEKVIERVDGDTFINIHNKFLRKNL